MEWNAWRLGDDAGLLQRGIRAVLRDGLQSARGEFHGDEFLHLRHPDALDLEVRQEVAARRRGDVLADAAFFLRETATVNFAALQGFGSVDVTNAAHKYRKVTGEKGAEHRGLPLHGQG